LIQSKECCTNTIKYRKGVDDVIWGTNKNNTVPFEYFSNKILILYRNKTANLENALTNIKQYIHNEVNVPWSLER
jgi:hypothetical protein